MSAFNKLLIAIVVMTTGLWFMTARFVGSTDGLSASLDVKSLAYIRPEPADDSTKKAEPVEIVPEVATELPERPESPHIPVKITVVEEEPSELIDCLVQDNESTGAKEGDEGQQNSGNQQAAGESGARDCVEPTDYAQTQTSDSDARQIIVSANEADEQNEEELTDREKALREALGIKERVPPTRAIDVALDVAPDCDVAVVAQAPVAVKFRFDSPTIRGESLYELEVLIAEYRRCSEAAFQMQENPLGVVDATPDLTQRRLDELKYFFIQHQVPKTALRYPDDL